MKITLEAFGFLLILFSLLPLIKTHYWWIRILDFPRAQVAFFSAITLGLYIYISPFTLFYEVVFAVMLGIALLNEIIHIYRFTPLSKIEALRSKIKAPANSFSIMVSNVRMSNKKYDKFLKVVRENDPDILLINEPNQRWANAIADLDQVYPYSIKKPQENTYGMMLYSKFKLVTHNIQFIVEDDIPSFYAVIQLPSGKKIDLFTVHPRPPHYDKNTDTREAELLQVAQLARQTPLATIVAGDLNDVAWSYTTHLFRKISGLLDPRIGRGFFNTYNALIPFFRYSLDHIFYDPAFRLIRIKRLPKFGSDHFPMFLRLNYEPLEAEEQEVPAPEPEEEQEAQEMIDNVIEPEKEKTADMKNLDTMLNIE
ncbi:endonuclease/exonuclease/phosphatase family protein [Adhaeribacter swui]|uniref:Endonuclease/exonuclease/phosphatase family protein n=1 Tax=Adhaeribacter swui TaxID=2086471 RepID=A0A7G7G559_9BACT|nr:endonuclease/exonuclease/phosphatase family protein [Adhaeribacter swui]QNF32293.1 endonuclease/exonuclease/phosphatase family protein [Adhaeribacter swui]